MNKTIKFPLAIRVDDAYAITKTDDGDFVVAGGGENNSYVIKLK